MRACLLLVLEVFITLVNSNLNEWNGQIPIFRSQSPDDVPNFKVCRMFGSTGPIPFGISGDNDYILTSYWYADGKGDSCVAQMAYNIRADETATRRYHPIHGWQPWININSLIMQTTQGKFILGSGLKIQWGCTASRNVKYDIPYTQTPVVTLTPLATNGDFFYPARVWSVSATEFNYKVEYVQNNGIKGVASEPCCWLAIGY